MKAIAILGVLAFAGCASRAYVEEDQVAWENCKNLLLQQAEAWNRGELEVFVLGYRRSPQTLFVTDDEVRVGFDDMLARYKKTYPNPESMGKLSFESLRFMNIDADHVICTGTFILRLSPEPDGEERWGRFSLIFRQENDTWKITMDYMTRGVGVRPAGEAVLRPGTVETKRNIDPLAPKGDAAASQPTKGEPGKQ